MTWETERARAGRRPFTVVELDLDLCDLTYSNTPCQAILGGTGDHKCFNTRVTCQDLDNYTSSAKTYRFCDPVEGVPRTFDAIPSLRSVTMAPAVIDPGQSLGQRASVTCTFQDHPHHDRGIDKYVSERATGAAAADGSTYTPFEQGTFWGRLRARNPYYVGRTLRIRSGYLPWDHNAAPGKQPARTEAEVLAHLRTRTYVIQSISGPDASGAVTVEAKDPLKLASDDRAECPVQTTGRLSADLSAGVTSATLAPTGVGDLEYGASGTVLIGSELMTFTRSGDDLTLTRGTDNTEAVDHKEDDDVQQCKRFASVRVDAIIQDLLENFAGIDASMIPIADWQAEAGEWLSTHIFSVVIPSPVGVSTLVSELCEQSLCYLWWHEIDQEIKFRAIRPHVSEATVTDDAGILEGRFTRSDSPGKRISRVIVRFDKLNPVAQGDEADNYRQTLTRIDADAESAAEYGETRILRIDSRWLGANNRGHALQLAARMLARYRDDPVRYDLTLGAKDATLWTGDVFSIRHRLTQGVRGESETRRVQALEVEETGDGQFRYTLVDDLFRGRYGFIGPDGLPDYGAATLDQRAAYAWIASAGETFANGDAAYRII